ncbi:hypothetical protein AFULGI_00017060 [Archaeoglobus fulgidus DSM 8774]|jgi:hypothetical protein|uniref:Uncharacterized protein n=1 Tax=Archaeoglobus fulgidus DSM 8774 TaxID=1344584 RepID=A0A075WDG1_ARCFL|nr:hypothetical protein [Archaeoglobus fulgidus]AIG98465.1 hypothetical protein AFULGI_00017060 [Archaeoglobus fulgidus DSM 8774]
MSLVRTLDVEIEVVEIPAAIEIIGVFDPDALNRILGELSEYIIPSEVEVNAKTVFDE